MREPGGFGKLKRVDAELRSQRGPLLLVAAGLLFAAVAAWVTLARPRHGAPPVVVPSHGARPFVRPPFLDGAFRLWNRFLIKDDGAIILAVNETTNGRFQLFQYQNGGRRALLPEAADTVDAFLDGDSVVGLVDERGDNQLVPTDPAIAALIPGGRAERVFGAPDHRSAVVWTAPWRDLYWIDFRTRAVELLWERARRLEGVTFCSPREVVFAADEELIFFDLQQRRGRPLAVQLNGRKRNPSCAGGELFFSAYGDGDFLALYRIADVHLDVQPVRILAAEHDLLEPHRQGAFLYYAEVVESEYLLRRMELASGRTDELTRRGVVYGYAFAGPDTLVYSYRDLQTPAAIVSLSLPDKRATVVEAEHGGADFTVERLPARQGRSTGFVFSPPKGTPDAGTVLYFAPAGADVSPRWERQLMTILYQGYKVFAPNPPGSAGMGRAYEQAPPSRALEDYLRWGAFLKVEQSRPLCYLSVSSGNVPMEQALQRDSAGVAAAAAFFGLASGPLYMPPVPTLFALGENDPIIAFEPRRAALSELARKTANVHIASYPGEGHWFRSREDLADLAQRFHELCQRQ